MTKTPPLVFLLSVLLLTGCATKMEVTHTGFLANYDQLVPSKTIKGMHIYKNEAVNIKETYSKIMIAPVEILLAPQAQEKFKDEEEQRLTAYFHESLEKKLSKQFELTDTAGPGVLLLRTAITDILPNKVYLNLHWSTTLIGAGIGGASIEAELIDTQSKERLLAFIDAKKGKKLKYTKGLSKWGHTKEVLDKWADILVENLSELEMAPEATAKGH